MQVKLLKDWGRHNLGTVLDIKDKTVLKKGFSIGLFSEELENKPEPIIEEQIKKPNKPKKK